jgi:tetratricopeptide (TPR) repeat protein
MGADARAIDEATKATRHPEVSSFAFALLGRAHVRSGDLRRAHSALQNAVARDPGNLVARNTLAVVLWKLGQRDAAEVVVKETRSRDPNDGVAVTWKAVMAATELRPELDLNPQVVLDLACFYWALNLKPEGLVVLREGLIPQPPIPWGVPEVDVVHKSGKAYPILLYFAALLEKEVGDASRVPELLSRASAASPNYVFPDRWEEERILRQVADLAPSDWRIPHALGNYLQARDRQQEAVLSWKRALELGSTSAVTHRNLGVVAWRLDRDRVSAQTHFEAALQQDPEDPIHYRNLAQLLMEGGEDARARIVLEKAADLSRQRSDVLVLLARCLHRLGEDEKAVALMAGKDFKVWEGGSESYEIHAAAHMALGKKAFEAKDHRKALHEFEVALVYPENLGYGRPADAQEAEMYYWIGLAKDSLGDSAGAREAFARAAKEIDHGSAENRALAQKAKSKF